MTVYIDFINNLCFILSPKCGTQTISKHLRIPLNIKYSENEIKNILNDTEIKKVIVVRDVIDRFYSGFIEDFKNNDCYLDLDISFYEYIKFIAYCYDNKLKNVNNLNIYYSDKDKLIQWGECSSLHLPITDSCGNLSGHIVHQKKHLEPYTNLIDKNNNVEIIDISELNKFTNIHENIISYKKADNIDYDYDFNTLLSDLKKRNFNPKKEKMFNKNILRIINHIYDSDNEFINNLRMKFK